MRDPLHPCKTMDQASPNDIELAPGAWLPADALRYRFSRSPGPGGQNVNKLNTKATLIVSDADLAGALDPGALARLRNLAGRQFTDDQITISSAQSRSQLANRRACLQKLRYLVVRALVRPKRRKPTRPSRAAIERRLKQKAQRSRLKRQRTNRPDPSET